MQIEIITKGPYRSITPNKASFGDNLKKNASEKSFQLSTKSNAEPLQVENILKKHFSTIVIIFLIFFIIGKILLQRKKKTRKPEIVTANGN